MRTLSHCVTIECAVTAVHAFEFLADGLQVGRWALGAWEAQPSADGLFRAHSLFDNGEIWVRPVPDRARFIVDYHVGSDPMRLTPRIMARVVPGPCVGGAAECCLATLIAWRDAAMSEERWQRLIATHEVEIHLIKSILERERAKPASTASSA
jgi:hypothetical protein